MRVLVDTSVWSEALRRKEPNAIAARLGELIMESMVVMIGPVRQEILSGISNRVMYDKLRDHLQSFDDLPITTEDYETAAEYHNLCRKNGIQGSSVDFLICAVAMRYDLIIFTTDLDFERYAQVLPIRLFA